MIPKILSAVLLALVLPAPEVLAAGRQLAAPPLVAARRDTRLAAVAESGGRFLTVWADVSPLSETRILGVFSDAAGSRIGTPFLIAAAEPESLEVVGAGETFAVFWMGRDEITRLTEVDRAGTVVRTPALDLPPHHSFSAASDGQRFLLVLTRTARTLPFTQALLLSREGDVLETTTFGEAISVTEIVATPDAFFVFGTALQTLYVYAVRSDGSFTRTPMGRLASAVRATALENGDLLVVWSTVIGGYTMKSRIWSNGTATDETTLAAGTAALQPLELIPSGGRSLLVYAERRGPNTTLMAMFLDGRGAQQTEATPLQVVSSSDDVRAAASDDRILIVFRSASAQAWTLMSIAVDRNGTARPPQVLIVQPADQTHPRIAAGGGAMVAAWNEATDDGTRIRTAQLGRTLETESDHVIASDGVIAAADLAWNGSEFLAIFETPGRELFASRVSADGSPVAGPPAHLASGGRRSIAVTWAGDRWLVAWTALTADGSIQVATVTAIGTTSQPRSVRLNTPPPPEGWFSIPIEVALSFDGRDVHLTWIQARWSYDSPHYAQGTHVFTTKMRRDGRLLEEQARAIPASQPDRISTAANDDALLVLVDERSHTTASLIDVRAPALPLVSTRTLYDWRAESDLTWDGRDFVAALHARGQRRYLSVLRLARDGSLATTPRGTSTLDVRHSTRPSVASTPSMDAVIAVEETDDASSVRAVVYSEREMPGLPDAPPPPANARMRRLVTEWENEVTWDGTAEAYVVEGLDEDGAVRVVAFTTETRLRTAYDTVRIRAFAGGVPSTSTGWISAPHPRRRATRR